MASRERFSPVDTAWLRMDRPNNLMIIVGVMMFDGALDLARLKRTLEARLLRYRRFRQSVVSDVAGFYWEDDQAFDIAHHVHRTALPGQAGKQELQELVAELLSSPLDPARPLWQFHVVENYRGGESIATAMILRIHHAIADGIALIRVILSLTDPAAAAPIGEAEPGAQGDEDSLWRAFFEPLGSAMAAGLSFSTSLWAKYWSLLLNPGQVVDYAKAGAGIAAEIAKLAAMPGDAQTRFKGIPGLTKRVAWADPIPLADVKAVGKTLGCSVNDILLAAAAGALSAYLAETGEDVIGDVRAMVQVNLRKPGEEDSLGNHFGMVTLDLPMGVDNPLARVYEIRRRMEELKHSYQAMAALTLLAAVGLMPKSFQELVIDLLAAKASVVMTNVPGPLEARYMAGSRIAQQIFWVPQSGNIGLGVSILSYDGKVQFGMVTDAGLVPDPERVVERFAREFEKLLYILLLEPDAAERTAEEVETRLGLG